MTLSKEIMFGNTEDSCAKATNGKSLRPVRSKRYSRRSFGGGNRPAKRLFTPEIKRYLKDWLVRRRDNPYPNREEKKFLANETGLTYIQICNWFANWRRKLKNVSAEQNSKTWSHLIKTYNDQAHGNVEQFSICSDDSIWGEPESNSSLYDEYEDSATESDNVKSPGKFGEYGNTFFGDSPYEKNIRSPQPNSYSEYSQKTEQIKETSNISGHLLLSKWLESAAKFQPSENNYSYWAGRPRIKCDALGMAAAKHGRDEVEAAMALTTLATAGRFQQ